MHQADSLDRELVLLGERADLLVQSVTDHAIYMLDPRGIVASWNAGAERLKGYSAAEIIGQHFSNFYDELDRRAGMPQRALRMAREHGRFEAEGWRVRKDGSRFWANVVVDPIRENDGTLLGFANVTRDLTERKRAEEELRRSEERFRLLVQSVTDYAIYMLDPEGRITSWNVGAERFKGYSADEIIGEHFSRFYTPEEAAAGAPQKALAMALSNNHFEIEGWRVRKDGSQFWANVVIDPIRNFEGTLIGFAKITRDLSERRDAQIALEKTREAFFHAQKMEAIGQLTGGVAHDFNNLLSAIIGSLDLAERRAAAGADFSKFLQNARLAAERGATLTQRMLSFARKQELKLESVDLAKSVRNMADLMARTLGGETLVETRFEDDLPPARADAAQLELALLNLIVNARDAMPSGGQILISARQDCGDEGSYVVLAVTDDGEGMDAETLRKATEPFFTTKGVGRGTGLGLPMVLGLAEQCGGRLVLHSEPGKGTSAELWLKVATEKAEVSPPKPVEPELAKPLEVLIVDDDLIVLMNAVAMLEDMGHRVHEATNAAAALDVLQQHRIDLMLSDFAMPGMNGAELIARAAQSWPDVKAILISGYAELPKGSDASVPRLCKPYVDHDLRRIIAEVTKDHPPRPANDRSDAIINGGDHAADHAYR